MNDNIINNYFQVWSKLERQLQDDLLGGIEFSRLISCFIPSHLRHNIGFCKTSLSKHKRWLKVLLFLSNGFVGRTVEKLFLTDGTNSLENFKACEVSLERELEKYLQWIWTDRRRKGAAQWFLFLDEWKWWCQELCHFGQGCSYCAGPYSQQCSTGICLFNLANCGWCHFLENFHWNFVCSSFKKIGLIFTHFDFFLDFYFFDTLFWKIEKKKNISCRTFLAEVS